MRTSIIVLVAAFVLVFTTTACSSGNPQPATVRNYGPEAQAPGWQAPPAPQAQPGAWPAASPSGGFQWHSRLADAQAAARSSGKLILAMSTKPNCGLCEKFKTETVPSTAGQVDRIAVGYIYNILRPEVPQVDQTLRANLQGASLMPLVGFLTPDLRWVHGFWGARSVGQFQGDIAQAQRIYPVSAPAIRTVPQGPAIAAAPVINEYGEPEWSPPGDVWPVEEPEPIDAITGEPGTVDVSQAGAALAEAPPVEAPAPLPTVAPEPIAAMGSPDAYVGVRPPMPPEPAARPVEPPAPAPLPLPEPAPLPATEPSAPAPAPAAAPAPAPATVSGSGIWGTQQLQRALEEIRLGRFDVARSTLEEVRTRMPETTHAREASKGCVALYNARRIRGATSGDERTRYLSRARRDLGASMWGVLFES